MIQFGIYYNYKTQGIGQYLEAVRGFLDSRPNVTYTVFQNAREFFPCDFLITLGGDGTILNVALQAAQAGIPIIAVNCGTVGFLAEFEKDDIEKAITLALSGDYPVTMRSIVRVETGGEVFFGLNEINLSRIYGESGICMTTIGASIDDNPVDTYRGDGVIVATPTGSTAYSLSAGGSVLPPDIRAFMLTPVCCHALHRTPIVFSEDSVAKFDLSATKTDVALYCDGKLKKVLSRGATVVVRKAAFSAVFIRNKSINFYNKLLIKLNGVYC